MNPLNIHHNQTSSRRSFEEFPFEIPEPKTKKYLTKTTISAGNIYTKSAIPGVRPYQGKTGYGVSVICNENRYRSCRIGPSSKSYHITTSHDLRNSNFEKFMIFWSLGYSYVKKKKKKDTGLKVVLLMVRSEISSTLGLKIAN